MDVEELVASTRRKIGRLQETMSEEERFLVELEKRAGVSAPRVASAVQPKSTTGAQDQHQEREVAERPGGGSHASLTEKRRLALSLIRTRPGRWTTREMEAAFREHGIDPKVGTPAKNVLWNLAREGRGTGVGRGAYDFPEPSNPEVATEGGP